MQVTRKNQFIAAAIGTGSAETLQAMLTAGKSNYEIAAAMGCGVGQLTNLLAQPAPTPLVPDNWTATNTGPCPNAGRFFGIPCIAYAGPQGGFTWGPPAFANGSTDGS